MKFHYQNLTDDELPLWRHGLAWWRNWSWEWSVFHHPRLGISFGKGGYDDSSITFSIQLLIFSFHIARKFRTFFNEKEFKLYWYEGSLWLQIWGNDDHYRRDLWWKRLHAFHVREWITGRPKFSEEKGEAITVFIPLPEGSYRAIATPETMTWSYRFGFTRVRKSVYLSIPGGIPFSGKGENSWDCGDDGLCGIGGKTLEEAIGNAVASVMKSRKRYGFDSKETGKVPVLIKNAR